MMTTEYKRRTVSRPQYLLNKAEKLEAMRPSEYPHRSGTCRTYEALSGICVASAFSDPPVAVNVYGDGFCESTVLRHLRQCPEKFDGFVCRVVDATEHPYFGYRWAFHIQGTVQGQWFDYMAPAEYADRTKGERQMQAVRDFLVNIANGRIWYEMGTGKCGDVE